ncbi:MAG: phosphoglycerate dehydrogenase [Gemmataceae bacterium]|nr:phosphoglycerate dehydrogenase [Gemmataceae bacterium]MDW8266372.1 phosphoglycerate dehydrogenase [Gemmataceae bacterium]
MPRVLISDKLETAGLELLRAAGMELDERHGLKGDALRQALRAADGVIVRSGTQITAAELEDPGRLRVIVRAGTGVDNIDVAAATRKGIVVMNTPGGNTVSTAEHTITLLLALARLIPAACSSLRQGKWERNKFVGCQLAGKSIGIVGLGRIGREVARRAAGLDMKVLGYDPFLAPERAAQLGIEAMPDLETLLPRVDFLTVHTPLTEETRDLIGARQLAMLPRGARVINCARGGIVNEAALAEALRSGHLAGAAVDVFAQEPPPPDHPLLQLPNVVATPHLGASTVEAQESVAREAAQLLIDFLTRGVVQFAVNMAAVDRTELAELRLYVDLARRLGLLHAQMAQGTIRRAELHYRGEIARRSTRLVTAAFTAGLLEYRLAENVNIVNAELLARERGIEIIERTSPRKGDFSTLLQAEVTTDKKTYTAAGTLFGHQFLRLVQLGPYHLDAYIDGIMLLFSHRDVPGLIGFIGTIFGKHGVNIAQMTVGRQQPGGEAIAVLNLDSPPPEEALSEVRSHPQISSVSVVKLPPAGVMPAWFG